MDLAVMSHAARQVRLQAQTRSVRRSVGFARVAAGADGAPGVPEFILATEGEATDTNIIRMHWDFTRAEAGICPILGNHDVNAHLGTWRNLRVEGSHLIGAPDFDMADPEGARWAGKVSRGYIRSCSVGWIPGALTLRGDLDESDPLWREPIEDSCGERVEGYVMGSEAEPNVLVEASLTPVPSDPGALALDGRAHAERQIAALARGERVVGVDLAGVLLALRDQPAVRKWARGIVAEELANQSRGSSARTLKDMTGGR